jgi:hypothetical protein
LLALGALFLRGRRFCIVDMHKPSASVSRSRCRCADRPTRRRE